MTSSHGGRLARLVVLVACCAATLSGTACDMGPSEASTLSMPRFLAAQTTPSSVVYGEPVTLDLLVWEVTDITWSSCETPWAGTAEGLECQTGATDMGTGLSITVTPEDRMWLLATDASGAEVSAHPMVVAIVEGGPEQHIEVTGIVDVDGAQLTTVETEGELELMAVTTQEVTSGGVTTFYASDGAFEPWRKAGTEASKYIAPEEPGEVTLIAVVRETDGALGWATTQLTVVAP